MKYEVIIFDADNTLFDFNKSEKVAFTNLITEYKLTDHDNLYEIYHQINSQIWNEFEQGLISQEKLKTERFNRLAKQLKINLDADKMAKSYTAYLANASFLYSESVQIIKDLSLKYRLLIITNGLKDIQENRISKSIISSYFEAIIISEVVKVAKPDYKIFEYALNSINYNNKSKILMVGDSLTSDIQGGINFGIDTCWYNPQNNHNSTKVKPTYIINNLLSLYKIIEP